MSGLQCVVNQHTAHACALAMAYGCLVWVGGPRAGVVAQPRCLAGYLPSTYPVSRHTRVYPVYTHPPKPYTRYMASHSGGAAAARQQRGSSAADLHK